MDLLLLKKLNMVEDLCGYQRNGVDVLSLLTDDVKYGVEFDEDYSAEMDLRDKMTYAVLSLTDAQFSLLEDDVDLITQDLMGAADLVMGGGITH